MFINICDFVHCFPGWLNYSPFFSSSPISIRDLLVHSVKQGGFLPESPLFICSYEVYSLLSPRRPANLTKGTHSGFSGRANVKN